MNNFKTGGPAFPVVDESQGMTLRDYFAAKAMQAEWSDPETEATANAMAGVAERSYKLADAMIAARNS